MHTGTGGQAEFISGLAFGGGKSTLAAGTNLGNIIMWRHSSMADTKEIGPDSEESWQQEPTSQVSVVICPNTEYICSFKRGQY